MKIISKAIALLLIVLFCNQTQTMGRISRYLNLKRSSKSTETTKPLSTTNKRDLYLKKTVPTPSTWEKLTNWVTNYFYNLKYPTTIEKTPFISEQMKQEQASFKKELRAQLANITIDTPSANQLKNNIETLVEANLYIYGTEKENLSQAIETLNQIFTLEKKALQENETVSYLPMSGDVLFLLLVSGFDIKNLFSTNSPHLLFGQITNAEENSWMQAQYSISDDTANNIAYTLPISNREKLEKIASKYKKYGVLAMQIGTEIQLFCPSKYSLDFFKEHLKKDLSPILHQRKSSALTNPNITDETIKNKFEHLDFTVEKIDRKLKN